MAVFLKSYNNVWTHAFWPLSFFSSQAFS